MVVGLPPMWSRDEAASHGQWWCDSGLTGSKGSVVLAYGCGDEGIVARSLGSVTCFFPPKKHVLNVRSI